MSGVDLVALLTPDVRRAVLPRLLANIDDTGDCWLWKGWLTTDGYGQMRVGGRFPVAHRVTYTLLVGPIPDGLQLDHLCRVRACVNPSHLEPVTNKENCRRGAPAQRGHCVQGHAYEGANLYVDRLGHRICRTCSARKSREYRTRRAAA